MSKMQVLRKSRLKVLKCNYLCMFALCPKNPIVFEHCICGGKKIIDFWSSSYSGVELWHILDQIWASLDLRIFYPLLPLDCNNFGMHYLSLRSWSQPNTNAKCSSYHNSVIKNCFKLIIRHRQTYFQIFNKWT